MDPDLKRTAEAVRAACVAAARQAYEDAGISGLCAEGRWECAVEAMRHLDLAPIVDAAARGSREESRRSGS